MPSVTVQIRGGLGNQLFMYAMARRLATANQVPLFLDTGSGFKNDFYRRNYGLDRFNICDSQTVEAEAEYSKLRRAISMGLNSLVPFSLRRSYHESGSDFDPRYLSLKVKQPIHVYGYWQDERYFDDVRSELKTAFTLQGTRTEASLHLAEEMRQGESVAVHLRLLHGVPAGSEKMLVGGKNLPEEYYRFAISEIQKRTTGTRFYIFSDRKEIPIDFFSGAQVTRVASEGEESTYEDLWLMSQCRHFVIANSTYSWWGAWMGRTDDSIIISPSTKEWTPAPSLPKDWNAIQWSDLR